MSRYRWIDPVRTAHGSDLVSLGVVGDILASRGIASMRHAAAYFDHHLSDLPDPSSLPDVQIAAERIQRAIANDEMIAIFGDYDVDGVTSTALITLVLRQLGARVQPFLPHREHDGYGLNTRAVDEAADAGCTLLITVDCGTGNRLEIAHAASRGIDTIVIDHHHVTDNINGALAFVSPRRSDSEHPFQEYAAVGVTFQVLRYLTDDNPNLKAFLPIVAVGTVADVVPLVGANRILVRHGLDLFAEYGRPGLQSLAHQSGVRPDGLNSHHIGFMLGPRINAAGRIDDPHVAFRLLMSDDPEEAEIVAAKLGALNRERQELLEEYVEEARMFLVDEGAEDLPVLVVRSPDWRVGLVGLVASRLSGMYHRPVIAIEQDELFSRGSARSIDEFNIVHALDQCADVLEKYGGHSKAAGLTIATNRIIEFTKRINSVFIEMVGPTPPLPTVQIDADVDAADVSLGLVDDIGALEPFGNGNPAPILRLRDVVVDRVRRSRNGAHLLFHVANGHGTPLSAVYFGAGDRFVELAGSRRIDLTFCARENTWRGRTSVSLEVADFRSTG